MSLMLIGTLFCATALNSSENSSLTSYFGGVGASFYTHIMFVTREGYTETTYTIGTASNLWYLYIMGFVVISSVMLLNLMTGMVVASVVSKKESSACDVC